MIFRLICLVLLSALMLPVTAAEPVVSVDLSSSVAAVDDPLVLMLDPVQRGREWVFSFRTESYEPTTALLRITGFPQSALDIYSAGNYVGSYTAEELAAGIRFEMPGGIFDADKRRLLEGLEGGLNDANTTVRKNPDQWPMWYELVGLRTWMNTLLTADRNGRSSRLLLIGKGLSPASQAVWTDRNVELMKERGKAFFEDVARVRKSVLEADLDENIRQTYQGWLIPLKVVPLNSANGKRELSITSHHDADVRGTARVITETEPGGIQAAPFNLKKQEEVIVVFDIPEGSEVKGFLLKGKAGDIDFQREIRLEE